MSNGFIVGIMTILFLSLGYMGIPVVFSLTASVLIATLLTDVSLPSMVGQLFNGINSETLLAVPFFLLAGEMMTSARITDRLIAFVRTLVGHFRSGLAQVVSVGSMFFGGISGSSTADIAAISTVIMPQMKKEGYDPAFSAALIAAASTIANMVPPSILAIVYGAVGNTSIGGLFLGGIVPGVMVCIGLMIYSYFFGPVGLKQKRSTFGEMAIAAREAGLTLIIPFIIIGGILSGFFTPTEAGMIAVIYILFIVIPLKQRTHIRKIPIDFMKAAVLYSLPLMAVASASCFGWLLAYLGGPEVVSGWMISIAGNNPIEIEFAVVILFVILGDFLDGVPAIIIFMPILLELQKLGGIHSLQLGVLVIVTVAFGLITPPCGLSLLLASSFAGVSFGSALKKALPLYLVFFVTISLIIFFPQLVLWLPKLVMPNALM
jgi:C4-dicarboxylate transporter DctM subunit